MKRAATVLIALLVLATVLDTAAARGATGRDPRAKQITDVVTKALPELQLQSVVFGVWDGKTKIAQGAIDAPTVQPPTAVDARVRVGQPMEAMLGTVLLQLAAEGKVDLDGPVEQYVPDLVNADRITPRMLANSTGGTPTT
jgi:D-alanyl-D-alanine carboxypeptidase